MSTIVILCCEFAKQPATRPFRVVMKRDTETGLHSVHTEYLTCADKAWGSQDGSYQLPPAEGHAEWLRRVSEKSEWYARSSHRVELAVPAYKEKRLST